MTKLNLSANASVIAAQLRRYNFAMVDEWKTWTPVHTGFSTAPVGGSYRYRRNGENLCEVMVYEPNAGTSNATTFTISAPMVAKTVDNMTWRALCSCVDNGASLTLPSLAVISSGSGTINLYLNLTGGASAWTNVNGKNCYWMHLFYEVDL